MRESKNGVKDAETKQSTKLRKQYWDKARHMRKQEQRDAETKQGTWESKEQRDAESLRQSKAHERARAAWCWDKASHIIR